MGRVLSRSELDPYINIFLGSNYLIINVVDKMLFLADMQYFIAKGMKFNGQSEGYFTRSISFYLS